MDIRNNSICFYDVLYQKDSGVYWCESVAGERSDAVNITVTSEFKVEYCCSIFSFFGGTKPSLLSGLSVILESPAVPVTEGDDVTLRCLTDTPPSSSGFTTDFYKDSLPFWSSSMANVTLRRVSKANEGLYKCNISGKGESPASWLTVRGEISSKKYPVYKYLKLLYRHKLYHNANTKWLMTTYIRFF